MSSTHAEPRVSTAILTIPNVISFARLSTVPVFLWLWFSGQENAAVAVYAVGAWTDFFDGYIARRTNSVSELGKLLDPFADRVFIVSLVVALIGSDALPLWLGLAIVVRDVLILAAYPLFRSRGLPKIEVNFVGKTATASLLFGLTWLAYSETTFPGHSIADTVGIAFTILGAVLYWVAGSMYARQAAALMKADGEA